MKRKTLLISFLLSFFALHTSQSFAQNALDFDGVDDFIALPNTSASIVGGSGITVSCYVFPRNVNAGWPDMDGYVGFRNNSDADFFMIQTTASNMEARFTNSSFTSFDMNYGGVLLNSWNHFVMSYDGSMLRLYHYGVPVDSVLASGSITNISESFYLGDLFFGPSDDFFLDGMLDEVGIWSRALSASEITCLYTNGPDLTDPDLKHFYHFNQGVAGGNNTSENALLDQMTTATGTLTGFALTGATSNWVTGTFFEFVNLDEEICNGEIFDFNGQMLTTAGTYFTTYSLSNGCDSSVVLNLSVNTTDVGVTQNGVDLMANAVGATYQWIDCADDSPIIGATTQSYTATIDGDYAVIVTENACTDTSDCFTVNTVGIGEDPWLEAIQLQPNPVKNRLHITMPRSGGPVVFELINYTGQVVIHGVLREIHEELDLSRLGAGAYFIKLSVGNSGQEVRMIIKQ